MNSMGRGTNNAKHGTRVSVLRFPLPPRQGGALERLRSNGKTASGRLEVRCLCDPAGPVKVASEARPPN